MNNQKILYAAFDLFPSTKGAATHIAHNLTVAQELFDSVTLLCLGNSEMPQFQQEGRIAIRRCLLNHPNYLRRAELFEEFVALAFEQLGPHDVIHFRDIWSGVALLGHPNAKHAKKIFEVNGLPSIELPCHYPRLYRDETLRHIIRATEDYCLRESDVIVTVSNVNANGIRERNIPSDKIKIIPNTFSFSSLEPTEKDDSQSKTKTILYAGTLTSWQGVGILIKAFSYLNLDEDIELVLACSSAKHFRHIRKIINSLELKDRIRCLWSVSREQLAKHYAEAYVTVAPLTRCDRNELQGCCPLKIIESMAVGTPVIASDIEVCREIIDSGVDGCLVTPDSPRALAYALAGCLSNPDYVKRLGLNARKNIETNYHYDRFKDDLQACYQIEA